MLDWPSIYPTYEWNCIPKKLCLFCGFAFNFSSEAVSTLQPQLARHPRHPCASAALKAPWPWHGAPDCASADWHQLPHLPCRRGFGVSIRYAPLPWPDSRTFHDRSTVIVFGTRTLGISWNLGWFHQFTSSPNHRTNTNRTPEKRWGFIMIYIYIQWILPDTIIYIISCVSGNNPY